MKLTPITGSGKLETGTEISFNYTEDVSSLEPSTTSGGSGQVTASAIASQSGNGNLDDSLLVINNKIKLEHPDFGEIDFRVEKVSKNNDLISLTGLTVEGLLDVEKVAEPVTDGKTLKEAIDYYCSLVGVTPTYETALLTHVNSKLVNFMGWKGNVWDYLKQLCAGVSASDSQYVPMEVVVDTDTVLFRIANQTEANLIDNANSLSQSIDSFDTSKSVDVKFYKTEYAEDRVVNEASDAFDTTFVRNYSIQDQLQVDAGETIIKRFKINASLQSINQPTIAPEVPVLPYPDEGTQGVYVIVGSDDLPIQPDQWVGEGGRFEVRLTENPNEIEIEITAPQATELAQAEDPEKTSLAPYKIGVESSGGVEYPALYITGTGVFFEERTKRFLSGADPEYAPEDSATAIDNIFINKNIDLYTKGTLAAQKICGPNISLKLDNPKDPVFKDTVGSIVSYNSNKYRIKSCSFSQSGVSMETSAQVQITDFNSFWTGSTFADFTSVMKDPDVTPDDYISFNEFSVIPLYEEV